MRGITDEQVPKFKLGLHCFQIFCVVVAWICEIIVFKNAAIVGNNGWVFGLCFLSIPAWIYLIMAPRFDRTRRFAEPHAMLALDVIFTILWLSAFAAQAAYNTYGKCKGACGASKAIVGLGVLTCVSWIPCIIISMYTLQAYNNNGQLPGYTQRRRFGDSSIDPDKAAFSMDPADDNPYISLGNNNNNNNNHDDTADDPYAAGAYGGGSSMSRLDPYDEEETQVSNGGFGGFHNSTGQTTTPLFDSNTEYSGTMNSRYGPSPVHGERENMATPAPVYEDHMIPHGGTMEVGGMPYGPDDIQAVRFPAANYDRVH